MKQARLLANISHATAVTPLFHGFLQRTSADCAVYFDVERAGARSCLALSFPFDSPLRAADIEGLGLCVPAPRPLADRPPSNLWAGFLTRRRAASPGHTGRQEQRESSYARACRFACHSASLVRGLRYLRFRVFER